MQIKDDKNETLGVYCGPNTGRELRLTGRYAAIIFHSDYSFQERGFLMVFSFNSICKYYKDGAWFCDLLLVINLFNVLNLTNLNFASQVLNITTDIHHPMQKS